MASGIAHREWQIARSDYMTEQGVDEDAFRAAVQHELAMAEHIGERLGVAILAAPRRERLGSLWITLGWVFKTASVPSVPSDEPLGRGAWQDPEPDVGHPYEDDTALVEDADPLAHVE